MTPDQTVADWNARHPKGTPVRYWPVKGRPDNVATRTRSAAWVLGGHTPVVMVEGISGGVSLAHVEPDEMDAFEAATGIRIVESDAVPVDRMLLLSPTGVHDAEHAPQDAHVVQVGDGIMFDVRHGVVGVDVARPADEDVPEK